MMLSMNNGYYLTALQFAVLFTVVADVCFIYAFFRGGLGMRIFACACLVPTLFVAVDVYRRMS